MKTLTRKTYPAVNPTVRLDVAPIAPCELLPAGLPGQVAIDGTTYAIAYHGELPEEGDVEIHGYQLAKEDGTTYDLPADCSHCECRDFLSRVRPTGCKHMACVRTLRNAGRIL